MRLSVKNARKAGRWSIDDMFRIFPNLGERAAAKSGRWPLPFALVAYETIQDGEA